jgi:hypothetical protein
MKPADFDQLSDSERQHFYKCEKCGKMVDMRLRFLKQKKEPSD